MNAKQSLPNVKSTSVSKLGNKIRETSESFLTKYILQRGTNTLERGNFIEPRAMGLYMALLTVGEKIVERCQSGQNEDALTTAMLNHVQNALANDDPTFATSMAHCDLWGEAKCNLNETRTGADILWLVEGLTSEGGFRAFWIQAKKEIEADHPYTINCFREANSVGYQLDNLRTMHKPEEGSFAMYLGYPSKVSLLPSLPVDKVLMKTPSKKSEGKLDLEKEGGVRLAEQLIYFATTVEVSGQLGQFPSIDAFRFFLSERNADLPMYLVVFSAQSQPKPLLDTLRNHYFKILGIKVPEDLGDQQKPDEQLRGSSGSSFGMHG